MTENQRCRRLIGGVQVGVRLTVRGVDFDHRHAPEGSDDRLRAAKPRRTGTAYGAGVISHAVSPPPRTNGNRPRSIAVVGAGFGGVGAAVMLRRAGYHDVTVFERGERVGGVWHHNTYPGAACDVPSHLYEFSFEPNPRWSRRYAPQAEIQAYLEDVARRHGVLDRIRTEHGGEAGALGRGARASGSWRPAPASTRPTCWSPRAASCRCRRFRRSRASRASTARRSTPRAGAHDVDLAGKRVAVVGTGCSAIQIVPAIQPIVEHVDVYQRSPGWTFPKMDFAYKERTKRLFERFPVLQRLDRAAIFAFMESARPR